jgi:hypothetical protein
LDTSVITITLFSGVYANFKEDACATSTHSTVASKDSNFSVNFSVTLPYTKTEFDTDKQILYKKAVTKAAGTMFDNVDIVSMTDARHRAGSVTVETKDRYGGSDCPHDDLGYWRRFEKQAQHRTQSVGS